MELRISIDRGVSIRMLVAYFLATKTFSSGRILYLTFFFFLNPIIITGQINEEDAQLIAKSHYSKYSKEKITEEDILPVLVYTDKENDTINFFAFNINKNKGFVIVSGRNIKNPVIGYSFVGKFIIPGSDSPPGYKDILENSSRRKTSSDTINLINGEVLPGKEFFNENLINKSDQEITTVGPLIKTKWGAGQYYNDSIPEFNGSKMSVGCVAVAIAQIMKYYNYPPTGSGKNFYDSPFFNYKVNADFGNTVYHWESMPDEISGPNSLVAQLLYHVGVSMNTYYDPAMTTADVLNAKNAIVKYFNFSERGGDYVNTDYSDNIGQYWQGVLTNEIIQKRPVLFGGHNLNRISHAFICDGYQDNFYHFNFGWNGLADGYYVLDDINGFNEDKFIITGIQPPKVGFAINDMNPGLNTIVRFQLLSNEQIDNCQWMFYPDNVEFVNGTNSNSLNPQVKFKNRGDYKVQLITNIQGETILTEKSIQVTFLRENVFDIGMVTACKQSCPVKWFDYDNDGDLDLIQCILPLIRIKPEPVTILYQNVVGNFVRTDEIFPSSYNGSISTFDYDNDGFLDVFITGQLNSTHVLKNYSGRSFKEVIVGLPQLASGTIMPGDFNNDGWMDLLMFGKNCLVSRTLFNYYIFQNQNGNFSLVFKDSTETNELYRNENIADFADLDNDGDLDIAFHEVTSNDSINGIRLLINDQGSFSKSDYILKGLGEGAIQCGDFDNDGDVDILSSSEKGISILINANSVFEQRTLSDDGIFWNRITCNDFNNDGKLDFFISSIMQYPLYYSNNHPNYNVLNLLSSQRIGIDTHSGDYNGDGYADLAISNEINRNYQGKLGFTKNTPPDAPKNLKYLINGDSITFSWDKSDDNQTPRDGLSYNLMVSSSPDKMDIVSPQSDLATGKRRIVGMGNVFLNTRWAIHDLDFGTYYWSVQAIDNAYEGSAFAPVSSFCIANTLSAIPSNKDVESDAGNTTFNISSNTSWSVLDNSDWLTASPISGDNNGTITATFTANSLPTSRVGIITISGTGATPQTVTVSQKGKIVLSLEPTNQDVGLEAGSTTFTIISNASWSVSDDANWLTVSPVSGNGNATIIATYIANPMAASSIGTITVSCSGLSPQSVTVSQSRQTGVITFDNSRLKVYPNPAKDFVTIKFDDTIGSDFSIYVTDALGKSHYVNEYKGNNHEKEIIVDLASLKSGLYFITVNSQHAIITYKIIKE